MGLINFDARTVQPQVGFDPLPEGWYKLAITKSNNKPVSTGKGGMLSLEATVIEGQYQGRPNFINLNLFHTESQQAVEMAYKELSAICHVTGVYQIQDQNVPDLTVPMLHNIPFLAHVVIVQGAKGAMNNIKAYKDIYGNDPGKQGQGQSTGQPASAPPGSFGPPGAQPQNTPQVAPPGPAPGAWGPSGAPAAGPAAAPSWQSPQGVGAPQPGPGPGAPPSWQSGAVAPQTAAPGPSPGPGNWQAPATAHPTWSPPPGGAPNQGAPWNK